MKNKWFWATLIFWMVFTSSIIAWALIYSPVTFSPKTINRFETEINGLKQKNEIWINAGRLSELLPIITKVWKKEGWNPSGNNLDLTPILFGMMDDSIDISAHMQIKVFQRNKVYKTLGLWEPEGSEKTYGFVSEVPDAAFSTSDAISRWKFPFSPPPNADRFYCQKLKNLQIALISIPSQENPPEFFHRLCASQGFFENLFSRDDKKSTYILTKNKDKILAVLSVEGDQDFISLADFKK